MTTRDEMREFVEGFAQHSYPEARTDVEETEVHITGWRFYIDDNEVESHDVISVDKVTGQVLYVEGEFTDSYFAGATF